MNRLYILQQFYLLNTFLFHLVLSGSRFYGDVIRQFYCGTEDGMVAYSIYKIVFKF